MSIMEVVLLILGATIFIAGYFVPVKKEEIQEETKEQLKEEVKGMVSDEMAGVKGRIDDIVDETITYAVEKTERAIERITNGNIMAVKEYSDSVLEGINKNHKEVLFMYDMLNEKQESIKETVASVNNTVKEAEDLAIQYVATVEENTESSIMPEHSEEKTAEAYDFIKNPVDSKPIETGDIAIQFSQDEPVGRNKNDRILELKKEGKSNVAIAKELGLGVGEVKLVIDLFEGID